MIISESRQFVFIHNPKCGGTTIRFALLPYDTTDHFFWGFHEIEERVVDKAHMPMHVFRKLYPDTFRQLDAYFVFMLVRDPYARAVSAFNESNRELLEAAFELQDQDAKRAAYLAAVNEFIAGLQPHNLAGWQFPYRHFVRQRDMAYLGRKNMTDCIIKLEALERGSAKLGVFDPALRQIVMNAEQQNQSHALPAREVLTEASVKKINELYADDFDLFEYDRW